MKDLMNELIEFTISLAFNIHKLTLIYTTVFAQWIAAETYYKFND